MREWEAAGDVVGDPEKVAFTSDHRGMKVYIEDGPKATGGDLGGDSHSAQAMPSWRVYIGNASSTSIADAVPLPAAVNWTSRRLRDRSDPRPPWIVDVHKEDRQKQSREATIVGCTIVSVEEWVNGRVMLDDGSHLLNLRAGDGCFKRLERRMSPAGGGEECVQGIH